MNKSIEVVAAIIKKDNTYFCAQRSDHGELAKKWEFPGGKIEKGETHKEALEREILEELNTKIEVKTFLLTINHQYKGFNLILHAYRCEVIEGNLELSEHLAFKWATIDEMKKMEFSAADIPVLDYLST
ncbi:(deoxy)nucleoside triphosphate pyrophosphohydrolase [Mariniplasma anaerobium]|uniref:8-oxo-dGTP diphosphatase n=1 Tax=Mariniplasma anaerobium TaxID=2735436 RepID=A0A7U9XUN4_9MOLU|nr:(deoxy)nucleoside triphosphate pyrophosphohydrolase [Mariniplasma anaerobium]BCR35714.1 NUDIX hydrolase [Mariniplasma anaerobium]